jgi:glucose-1-phosphate cytidylyltransferase
MKVVILCGGLGTRLRDETEFRPKPMVEIVDPRVGDPIAAALKNWIFHGRW